MAVNLQKMEEYRERSHKGSAARWQDEHATDPWAIDPIDRVNVAEFERQLVAKFGPEYLEPVQYVWTNGELTPVTDRGGV
jgi:hypothetical protein